jgi:hypothetical protein
MNQTEYAARLEKKMIEEFRVTFHDKLGYFPTVLPKFSVDTAELMLLSLDELKELFVPFLPYRYDARLSLDCKHRYREITELRFIFCYIAKQMKYTLTSIGDVLGKRDHTTVMNGLNIFHNLIETDPVFREKYQNIVNHIKTHQEKSLNLTANESSTMEPVQNVQYQPQSDIPD